MEKRQPATLDTLRWKTLKRNSSSPAFKLSTSPTHNQVRDSKGKKNALTKTSISSSLGELPSTTAIKATGNSNPKDDKKFENLIKELAENRSDFESIVGQALLTAIIDYLRLNYILTVTSPKRLISDKRSILSKVLSYSRKIAYNSTDEEDSLIEQRLSPDKLSFNLDIPKINLQKNIFDWSNIHIQNILNEIITKMPELVFNDKLALEELRIFFSTQLNEFLIRVTNEIKIICDRKDEITAEEIFTNYPLITSIYTIPKTIIDRLNEKINNFLISSHKAPLVILGEVILAKDLRKEVNQTGSFSRAYHKLFDRFKTELELHIYKSNRSFFNELIITLAEDNGEIVNLSIDNRLESLLKMVSESKCDELKAKAKEYLKKYNLANNFISELIYALGARNKYVTSIQTEDSLSKLLNLLLPHIISEFKNPEEHNDLKLRAETIIENRELQTKLLKLEGKIITDYYLPKFTKFVSNCLITSTEDKKSLLEVIKLDLEIIKDKLREQNLSSENNPKLWTNNLKTSSNRELT